MAKVFKLELCHLIKAVLNLQRTISFTLFVKEVKFNKPWVWPSLLFCDVPRPTNEV